MKRLIVLQDAVDIIANTPSEIANRVARGSKTHWTTKEVLGALDDRQFEIFVLLDMVKRVDATEAVKVETNIYDKEEIYPDCTVQVLTNTATGETSVGWRKNGD